MSHGAITTGGALLQEASLSFFVLCGELVK